MPFDILQFSPRQEIVRYALSLIPDSLQMLLSHTYFCITFLIMYGTMWALHIGFDARFFAVASCMLSYLEYSLMEFGTAIRHLVNYLAAAKRIQVCSDPSWRTLTEKGENCFFQTFLLLSESQRDYRLSSFVDHFNTNEHLPTYQMKHRSNQLTEPSLKTPCKVECTLQTAQWQQV